MRLQRIGFLAVLAALLAACNSDSQQLLDRAEARWREGNYEDAIRLNTLLYQRDPQGKCAAQALLRIGDIYYLNLRQVKDAVEAYKRLVSELPGRPEEYRARQQLAAIYENEIGDLTQAINEYDKILEAKDLDNRAEIQFRRANAYFKLQQYDTAWRELRRIEEAGVTGHLADQVYLKLGNIDQVKHQYGDAVAYFQRVAEAPCLECRRRALLNLAETYEALYDFDEAISTLGKLDRSDKQLADREVERLKELKRKADSHTPLSWDKPASWRRK
jgi:tetratricopeptide (TPR) repeat protein